MAEFNSEKNLIKFDSTSSSNSITFTNAITGGNDNSKHLYTHIIQSMKKAERIDIIVSFLMESGINIIIEDLKEAINRNVKIRILTGIYLGITQPEALYLIKKELGQSVDLRIFSDDNISFHPKSYFFHHKDMSEIYIGSSNISKSAFTSGIEWNYKFNSISDKDSYNHFYSVFEDLFNNHSIIATDDVLNNYSKNYKKPAVLRDIDKLETESNNKITTLFQPRGAQIEALYALDNTRKDGATKGLILAATGIGKTYLAAFDSINYERVLFIAHREEILKQAAESFRNVRKTDDYGFFNSTDKDIDKSLVFASIFTIGKKEYLNDKYFPQDYFDYIVIDEFHHAASKSYQYILEYFKPKFLLGLTATPERMDGKNIYEICDYNVPFEISLREAINKDILVPFHYYGVYDNTDYSVVRKIKGKYSEEDLTKLYKTNKYRFELIYSKYMEHSSDFTIGFCCSKDHAESMAEYFNKRNIPSLSVYSNPNGEFSEDRKIALERFKNKEIKVLFVVDMFNEGVDIPEIDMVMFLRPTESSTIYLQQLGRGLRKSRNKDYLTVLDFIGNYDFANRIITILQGNIHSNNTSKKNTTSIIYPENCQVNFDFKLIDIFENIAKKSIKLEEMILDEYKKVKEDLGASPTRLEFFTKIDSQVYDKCLSKSKLNPFKDYLKYKKDNDNLSSDEEILYNSIGKDFLNYLENTLMSKSYKMPILYSIYNDGNILMDVSYDQALLKWKEFFLQNSNWKDINNKITYDEFTKIKDKEHINKIKTMPITHLLESGSQFFTVNDEYAISLNSELKDIIKNEAFILHMKDIIDYRVNDYFRRRYNNSNNIVS